MSPGSETTPQEFSDYERVYLHMSRVFKHLDKEHWVLRLVCSLQYRPFYTLEEITARLRAAWKRLALEYPGLTVRPVDNNKVSDAPTAANLEAWVDATFAVEQACTAETIISRTGHRELPGLFFLSTTSEVILLNQHWRTDGLGCCMLLDRLFELTAIKHDDDPAGPTTGSIPLSPCLEAAAQSSFEDDNVLKDAARHRIDLFHANVTAKGGFPLDGDPRSPPAASSSRDLTLTVEETDVVVRACKRASISVTAAIHTALAQTYLSLPPNVEASTSDFTTIVAVNARPYLPPPYNGRTHACQTYVSSITPTVLAQDRFLDSAQELTREYRSWHTPELSRSWRWMYRYNIEKILNRPPPRLDDAAFRPPSGLTLSSLGMIERHLRGDYGPGLKVEGFHFGISMMTAQSMLYAWTFRGRLTLSLNRNEAYHSRKSSGNILSLVREILMEGLGSDGE